MKKKRISKTQNRETIGQTVYDNLHKQPDVISTIEIKSSLEKKYYDDLILVAQNSIDKIYKKVFYIEVIFMRDKPYMNMVLHPRFIARSTCPTPTWGQHVWEYDTFLQKLDLLWSIPFKEVADDLKRDAHILTEQQKILLQEVRQYEDGLYERVARKLNDEPKEGSNLILINNEGQA